MKRLKLILPAGRTDGHAMLADCKIVDADTGQEIEPVLGVKLLLPFEGDGPGVVTVQADLLIAKIEVAGADHFAHWACFHRVGVRPPGTDKELEP